MSKIPDKTMFAHHLLKLLRKDGWDVEVLPGEEILRFSSLEIRVIVVGAKKHYLCDNFPIPEKAICDWNDRSATPPSPCY